MVFIKCNTPLPSSASVERIFNVGGETVTKKRSSMTDDNFENIMFFKYNKHLFNK